MPFAFPVPRSFSLRSIRAYAPAVPGVYGLSNSRQWVVIERTDNIQAALLQHLSDPDPDAGPGNGLTPTGFAFEPCDAHAQPARQDRLVLEYEPFTNRRTRTEPGR